MKIICMALAALAITSTASAQVTKPTKAPAKQVKRARAVPDTSFSIPLVTMQENGESSFYDLKKGDQLVYHVSAGGKEYDFIVTLNAYGNGIDFNYEMTAPASKQGHVSISGKAMGSSKKYNNYFSGGELKLTDATTVWLCYDNFSEMPNKKTVMTMDNNPPETFYRPDKDEVTPTIKVKGTDMKIEGFMINNKADGTGDKTLWINGISSNPLILKMDLGWKIELKEVR